MSLTQILTMSAWAILTGMESTHVGLPCVEIMLELCGQGKLLIITQLKKSGRLPGFHLMRPTAY
jgi:hypothetical protein